MGTWNRYAERQELLTRLADFGLVEDHPTCGWRITDRGEEALEVLRGMTTPSFPQLVRDPEANAAYLRLRDIGPGEAVRQQTVILRAREHLHRGGSTAVLDYDADGKLLGIEFLDPSILPDED